MGKEKKEIGMEKLIELLNEYEPRIAGNGEHYDNIWWYRHFMSDKTVANNAIRYIVSKEYGFIKWLVENDKIDFEGKLNTIRFESLVDQTLDSYLALLMILSISSSPIEDLISYLK